MTPVRGIKEDANVSKNGKTIAWVVGGGVGIYLLYQFMQQQQANNAAALTAAAGNSTAGIIDSAGNEISQLVSAFNQ